MLFYVMVCYKTCYITYPMLYYVMLYNICYMTYVTLYNISYVML